MGEIIGRTESEIDRLWILEIKRVVRASSQGETETNQPVNGSWNAVQSAELDRGKSMAHTGLPNKEDAKIPSVPPRPCLFHQLALSKDRKRDQSCMSPS